MMPPAGAAPNRPRRMRSRSDGRRKPGPIIERRLPQPTAGAAR